VIEVEDHLGARLEVGRVARELGLRAYRVEPAPLAGGPSFQHADPPPWPAGVTLSGRALARAGLHLPVLAPEQALVLQLSAR
jgi:alpha-galactosidase